MPNSQSSRASQHVMADQGGFGSDARKKFGTA
jgi:hypothetical protein